MDDDVYFRRDGGEWVVLSKKDDVVLYRGSYKHVEDWLDFRENQTWQRSGVLYKLLGWFFKREK